MRVEEKDLGYFVWLAPEELEDEQVVQEMERLRHMGKTFVFVSGKKDMLEVLKTLLIKNISTNQM